MTIVHHEFYGTNFETLRIRAIVSFLTIEGEEKSISTNIHRFLFNLYAWRTIRSIVIWSGLQIPAIFFCGLYKLPEVWIAVGRSLSFPLDALAKQRYNVILQYFLPIFICRSDSFTFCSTGTFHIFAQIQRNMISNFVQFRLPILCCFTLFRKFVLNFSSSIHTPFVLLWSTVFRTEINKWDYKFARCTQYYTHLKREYLRNGELWLRLFLASFSISFCLNGSRFCSHPKWIIESNQDWDYFQCRLLMIFLSQGAIYEHTASIPTFQPSFCNICLR